MPYTGKFTFELSDGLDRGEGMSNEPPNRQPPHS